MSLTLNLIFTRSLKEWIYVCIILSSLIWPTSLLLRLLWLKKTILEKHSQFKLNLFKKRNIISGQANPLQWQMYKYTVFGWKTFKMRKHFACPKSALIICSLYGCNSDSKTYFNNEKKSFLTCFDNVVNNHLISSSELVHAWLWGGCSLKIGINLFCYCLNVSIYIMLSLNWKAMNSDSVRFFYYYYYILLIVKI